MKKYFVVAFRSAEEQARAACPIIMSTMDPCTPCSGGYFDSYQ